MKGYKTPSGSDSRKMVAEIDLFQDKPVVEKKQTENQKLQAVIRAEKKQLTEQKRALNLAEMEIQLRKHKEWYLEILKLIITCCA